MKSPEPGMGSPESTSSGSPQAGEPVYIAVGLLRRTHGVKGEMVMDVLTDFPQRLRPNRELFAGDKHEPVKLASVRPNGQTLLVRLIGYDTPEAAARFRNQVLYTRVDSLPALQEDEYYHHQLIGLQVVDESGRELGSLEDILTTGANDVYIVRAPDGGELMLPAVAEVVLEVDLENRRLVVRPQVWE